MHQPSPSPSRPPFRPQPLPINNAHTRAAIVARLQEPRQAGECSPSVMTLILSIRMMALALRGHRDPVVELTQRLQSLTAAKAVLNLAKSCSQAWAENVMVNPPCCQNLSPDEAVFADMAQAAMAGDRESFSAVLEGLVRRERHERLYSSTIEAIVAIG